MVFKVDKELQEIVKETIAAYEQFEMLNDARILVLYCDQDKKSRGKRVFADTKKTNELYEFITGYDFIITFYAGVEMMSASALRVLAYHELLHVGYEVRGMSVVKRIIPHDVEDFREVIGRFGVDWPLLADKAEEPETGD